MSLLEERYRAVLRLLPASYRAEREEEMVAAFMEVSGDVPDETNPRPRWGEIASVLALSVRVRLGGGRSAPRAFAWGEAVRLLALLGLAYQAMFAVLEVAQLVYGLMSGADGRFPGTPESAERLLAIAGYGTSVCAAVAFAAIVRGRARLAKVTAVVSAVPTLVYLAVPVEVLALLSGLLVAGQHPGARVADAVFTAAPVVALFLGFHGDVTPRRRSWRLVAAPAVAGLVLTGVLLPVAALRLFERDWLLLWLDFAGTAVVALAVGAVVALVRRRSPSWTLALAGAGLILLLVRLPMLIDLFGAPERADVWASLCGQCALLGVLVVALAVAGLRSLPPARPLRVTS
jgi:hypothetical protein